MKKLPFILGISCFVLFVFSCKKEISEVAKVKKDDNYLNKSNEGDDFMDISYCPKDDKVKSKTLDFLSKTKTGNASLTNSISYRNCSIEEGIWTMEAAANYLTNINLIGVNSDVIFKQSLSLKNISVNNETHIIGSEMTTKFDDFFNALNQYELSNNVTAKLVDFRIVSSNKNDTEVEIHAILGKEVDEIEETSTNISSFDAADQIEQNLNFSFLNRLMVNNGYSPLTAVNVVNQSTSFFSNVSILSFYITPDNEVNNGCPTNDCLWRFGGQSGSNINAQFPYDFGGTFPVSALPTFQARGMGLIDNYTSTFSSSLNFLDVFNCDYRIDLVPSTNFPETPTIHTIDNITVGNHHVV